MELTLHGFAIGNGILTVENEEQAITRADPKQGNKGGGAARAALALYELREQYAGEARILLAALVFPLSRFRPCP